MLKKTYLEYPDIHLHTFIEAGSRDVLEAVLQRVYLWMTLGLLVTASVAAFVSVSPLTQILSGRPLVLFGLVLAELALVLRLSWALDRISTLAAVTFFLFFSALNGLTFSALFVVYALSSLAYTFFASAALFAVMGIIGSTTKVSLAKMGTFLLMGLVGLVIAMLANIFWATSVLGWIITFVGIFLFLGLTAFDTQRIRRRTATALQHGDTDFTDRLGIQGALSLYLDFFNLFLFLLRLGGRKR